MCGMYTWATIVVSDAADAAISLNMRGADTFDSNSRVQLFVEAIVMYQLQMGADGVSRYCT
jgi:hypothetical protein